MLKSNLGRKRSRVQIAADKRDEAEREERTIMQEQQLLRVAQELEHMKTQLALSTAARTFCEQMTNEGAIKVDAGG